MKTLRILLLSLSLTGSLTLSSHPMEGNALRSHARYLTDRMVHHLNLSDRLLDDLYCINYDFLSGVHLYLDEVALGRRYDDYVAVLAARDAALRRLLTPDQWTALRAVSCFYRPVCFSGKRWHMGVYDYLPARRGEWYCRQPARYASYRGGRFFAGMSPARQHNAAHNHHASASHGARR